MASVDAFRIRVIVVLSLLPVSSAWAYVDPGSGMLLWQGFIALVGAVLVFFRHPLEALKRLFNRFRRK